MFSTPQSLVNETRNKLSQLEVLVKFTETYNLGDSVHYRNLFTEQTSQLQELVERFEWLEALIENNRDSRYPDMNREQTFRNDIREIGTILNRDIEDAVAEIARDVIG